MVIELQSLETLSAEQLREMAARLFTELRHSKALNEKLAYENALLKRMKFAAQSERFNPEQRNLLEDEIDADLAAVAEEIEQLSTPVAPPQDKRQAKRQPLPANLPRREIRHEPDSTTCQCGCQLKRIGEDVAEKLDYVPGVFSVERHVRGKWACSQCETIVQAPVDARVIDKGIPTAGLLAQVLVTKYADHLPLCRQARRLQPGLDPLLAGHPAWRAVLCIPRPARQTPSSRRACPALAECCIVKLPPFHGHLIVLAEGVRDAQSQAALPGAISRADGRIGSSWPQARRIGQRIWLSRHQHSELGAHGRCCPWHHVNSTVHAQC
jgi:transposase